MWAAAIAPVAGATCTLMVSRADLAVGPFVGPKPRRIRPYQARRKTPAGSQLLRLQVFSRVKDATNAMLHHARGRWFETTRGPSQKDAISTHFAGRYRGLRPTKLGPRVLARPACCAPEFAWPPRTAHERICRTAPCLTCERSPVRTQPRPSSSERWHQPRSTVAAVICPAREVR
jgi:hypothetical protein